MHYPPTEPNQTQCRWAWCRTGFATPALLKTHVLTAHVRRAAPKRLPAKRRKLVHATEDGTLYLSKGHAHVAASLGAANVGGVDDVEAEAGTVLRSVENRGRTPVINGASRKRARTPSPPPHPNRATRNPSTPLSTTPHAYVRKSFAALGSPSSSSSSPPPARPLPDSPGLEQLVAEAITRSQRRQRMGAYVPPTRVHDARSRSPSPLEELRLRAGRPLSLVRVKPTGGERTKNGRTAHLLGVEEDVEKGDAESRSRTHSGSTAADAQDVEAQLTEGSDNSGINNVEGERKQARPQEESQLILQTQAPYSFSETQFQTQVPAFVGPAHIPTQLQVHSQPQPQSQSQSQPPSNSSRQTTEPQPDSSQPHTHNQPQTQTQTQTEESQSSRTETDVSFGSGSGRVVFPFPLAQPRNQIPSSLSLPVGPSSPRVGAGSQAQSQPNSHSHPNSQPASHPTTNSTSPPHSESLPQFDDDFPNPDTIDLSGGVGGVAGGRRRPSATDADTSNGTPPSFDNRDFETSQSQSQGQAQECVRGQEQEQERAQEVKPNEVTAHVFRSGELDVGPSASRPAAIVTEPELDVGVGAASSAAAVEPPEPEPEPEPEETTPPRRISTRRSARSREPPPVAITTRTTRSRSRSVQPDSAPAPAPAPAPAEPEPEPEEPAQAGRTTRVTRSRSRSVTPNTGATSTSTSTKTANGTGTGKGKAKGGKGKAKSKASASRLPDVPEDSDPFWEIPPSHPGTVNMDIDDIDDIDDPLAAHRPRSQPPEPIYGAHFGQPSSPLLPLPPLYEDQLEISSFDPSASQWPEYDTYTQAPAFGMLDAGGGGEDEESQGMAYLQTQAPYRGYTQTTQSLDPFF